MTRARHRRGPDFSASLLFSSLTGSVIFDVVEEAVAAPVVAAVPLALDLAATEYRVHDLLGEPERRELDAIFLEVLEDFLKADTQLLRLGALADVDSDHAAPFVVDRRAGGTVEGDGAVVEEVWEIGVDVFDGNVAVGKLENAALRMLDDEHTSGRGRVGAAAVVPAADAV